MHLITLQLIALIGAGFLYAYAAKNGLGKIHRIFAGLIVLAVIAALITTLCCRCCKGGSGCKDKGSCTMNHGGMEGCGSHGGMKSCGMGGGHEEYSHGGGSHGCKMGHGSMNGCSHMQGDSMIEIEKTIIMKDGDSTVMEKRHH